MLFWNKTTRESIWWWLSTMCSLVIWIHTKKTRMLDSRMLSKSWFGTFEFVLWNAFLQSIILICINLYFTKRERASLRNLWECCKLY